MNATAARAIMTMAALGLFDGMVTQDRSVMQFNSASTGQTSSSKGKRSRKRRAAKLRAKGWIHLDRHGWLTPEEYAPQRRSDYLIEH